MLKFFRERSDIVIMAIVGLLLILGLAMVASASSSLSLKHFGNPYNYLNKQLISVLVGIAAFVAGRFFPIKWLKKASFPLLLLNLGLLILTFTPLGGDFGTSYRWLDIGGFSLQPSELLKITFIIYISAWLTSKSKNRKENLSEGLIPFLIICAIIGAILIAQPSTSILVILLLSAGTIYFIGGLRFSFLAGLAGLAAVAIGVVILFSPYRFTRITTFLHPEADPQKSGYHINQALITIGSGGLWGVGYGRSVIKSSLPEPMNDSIFAIIAEEFGFIGSILFISLYFLLIVAGLIGGLQTRNDFGKLMLVGFSAVIGFQTFIHIASISGLMPMTGVPLPFVSYGGTAIIVFMGIVGLMINALKNA
ncbi:MAG: FtsW/RodA/SpoVE family cell cycle protein [Candidatus Colwellbacteria bacterium]|nr:FtsW/RodA/SpoVE family cell cycle protein [Candidatus Colwellbacteria bacterium]